MFKHKAITNHSIRIHLLVSLFQLLRVPWYLIYWCYQMKMERMAYSVGHEFEVFS
jgi:hypothetical protein